MSNKLMSALWERSTTKGLHLFILIAIADNANDEGTAFPSIKTIAHKVRSSERTVQRAIRELEIGGHLKIETGGGRKSNFYRLFYPEKVTGDRMTPVTPDVTPPPTQLCHPTPDAAMSPEPSITQIEPPLVEAAPTELTLEAGKFVVWFLELLASTGAPTPRLTPTVLAGWRDTYEKLRRIDGKEKAEIAKVCEWARGDPFWSTNFYAPTKLRERKDGISRYDLFLERLKKPNGTSTTLRPNGRYFEQAGSYAGITDK